MLERRRILEVEGYVHVMINDAPLCSHVIVAVIMNTQIVRVPVLSPLLPGPQLTGSEIDN